VLAASFCVQMVRATAPLIMLETEVSWETDQSNSYAVQWSPPPGDGPWQDLGAAEAREDGKVYDTATGARIYRVVETAPASGGTTAAVNLLAQDNPGFEDGSTGWVLGARQTVTTAEARSGAASLRSAIPEIAKGALLFKNIEGVQSGRTYTFSFWAKQVSAGPSYVQHYKVEWIRPDNSVAVATGNWVDFRGGDGAWLQTTSAPLTAPADTVGARLVFYFATGAVTGAIGEVLLDDASFAFQAESAPVVGDQTRVISSDARPVVRLEWASTEGVDYRVEESNGADLSSWSDISGPLAGSGETMLYRVPVGSDRGFYRIVRPLFSPAAPANIRLVPTGIAGTISLAWDAAATGGITGYRVLYGLSPDNLDRSIDVDLSGSVTIPDLEAGQTYHVTVVALSPDGAGPAGTTVLAAQPEGEQVFQALFTASTPLEPDPVVETSTAKVTYLADRARDRHAREGLGFLVSDGPEKSAAYKYDHYLPFYWEQRVAQIEIVDEVAKGGNKVVFNFTTQAQLNPAEFRTFFNVGSPLSGYHNNQSDYLNAGVTLVSSHPSVRYPGETDYNYTATIRTKAPENRPLQIGDRMEVELSQFLLAPRNGRNNYYGTAFLYIVGHGVVPWYAKDWEEAAVKTVGVTSFDSYPLPAEAWLGGTTTLPYQYSNEPQSRFKQMAGNITPASGQPFLLGRRLHHTDFGTGAHSEQGNPVFAEQIGKAGPAFVARSCVACHANNGRSLLPAIGSPLDQAVVKVGASADGTPHPVLGEQIQPYMTTGSPEGGVVLAGFTETTGTYGDGTPYTLRKPVVGFTGAPADFHSLRVAPSLVGLGLLEAIPEENILALADPEDADGDGISGRPNYIADPEEPSVLRLGRFAYKADQPKVVHQIAYALNRDMGVTSKIFPVLDGESSPRPPEVSGEELDRMNRYVALLGVGARRDLNDPVVARGQQLFASASCVNCHTPSHTTGPYHPMGELRNQTIRPYTDLLLHDMGPGLADNLGESGVSGAEWRTAPLWNIGLSAGVSGGESYLHDGRARTLEEAILWHGGEAEQAKENFRTMPAADREAMLKFIRSL
jgi:CxxC motif-containing protein (DUF1111 family)